MSSDHPKDGPFTPTADVRYWLEQESSIMLRAVTDRGDPVELTATEARNVANAILELAQQLDAVN